MDFKDVFSSLGTIITLLIVVIFSIYLWSMIIRAIPVLVKFILKAAYVLALIGATILGTGYVLYSILLFVNGQPINLAFVLAALFCIFMGGMGIINMLSNIAKPSQISPAPHYTNRAKNTYGYYTDPLKEEAEERERVRRDWIKESADIDARIAQDRAYTREVEERNAEWANIQIERREAAEAYNKQQWDNWQQQQDEREEYSRQQREKWSQQDE